MTGLQGSWPTPNPVDALVFSADSSTVRQVLVAGELLLRDGDPVGVNVPRLLAEATEVCHETIHAAGLQEEVQGPWMRSTGIPCHGGGHGH